MITLNVGTRTFPLSQDEAVFVAESLLAAVSGKTGALPVFTSGMHGHLSVRSEGKAPVPEKGKGRNVHFRSNPQQSDHVLTDC